MTDHLHSGYSQSMPNLLNNKELIKNPLHEDHENIISKSPNFSKHSKQDSINTTYGVLDFYTESSDIESKSLNLASKNGISILENASVEKIEEPFTVISSKVEAPCKKKKIPITKTENYDSLEKSRNCLKEIRNKIDESIFIQADDDAHDHSDSNDFNNNNNNNNNSNNNRSNSQENGLRKLRHNASLTSLNQYKNTKSKSKSKSKLKLKSRTTSNTYSNHNKITKKSILNSERDRYGFKKSNYFITNDDYNNWWRKYSIYLIRRKEKWETFMEKNGLFINKNESPTRFPTKSDDLKKFVRKGIPAEWRGNAWFYFARGFEKLRDNKGVYDLLVEKSLNLINENTEAIEKDLHRTFPENIHFKNDANNNESPMLETLRRVLKCFSIFKPTIGYCQSLNFIAGLLLIFLDEEKTFWMLVIITETFLPGIHELNLEGVNVHQGVLMLCLRQYLPEVWKIINLSDDNSNNNIKNFNNFNSLNDEDTNEFLYNLPSLSFCTTNWFMSLFIGVLPIESTLRIWDVIFFEGSKAIFQICLTIFKVIEVDLKKIVEKFKNLNNNSNNNNDNNDNEELMLSELFQVIQNSPKKFLDINKIIEECFKFSNFNKLSQTEINKCKKYVINSRLRYQLLIKKRCEIGLKEQDRKELILNSEILEKKKIGLKSLNWNGKLNNRMRKMYRKGSSKIDL